MVLGFFHSLKRKNGELSRTQQRVDIFVTAKLNHSHGMNYRE